MAEKPGDMQMKMPSGMEMEETEEEDGPNLRQMFKDFMEDKTGGLVKPKGKTATVMIKSVSAKPMMKKFKR